MTQTTRGAALSLLLAAGVVTAAGCKKDKESLVLADLQLATADSRATNLSLTLTATPGPTREYHPVSLSASTTTEFGIYVPGDITGPVDIKAVARSTSGETFCISGTGSVTIASAGVTQSVTITMTVDDACSTGGTAGSGGTTGSGGSTGGRGGASGTAGSGGSAGGSGGSAAGSGGSSAGSGGNAAGSGGSAAGSGGSAAGTGGGSAGRGGSTAGTGGGSAGRGGTGGGSAGRGGSGGGGSTGTGGMAGYPSIASCRPYFHAGNNCPNDTVRKIAVAPNGQMVATVGNDYRIKIWSFDGQTLSATGKEWTANNYFPDAAFSPDSTRLVFPDGPFVRTFTVSGWVEGPPLKGDGANNDFKGAAFTPDGTKVISVDDRGSSGGTVYVHDINTTSGIPMTMKSIPDEPWSFGVSPRAVNGTVGIAVGGYPASSAPYAGAMNVLGLTGTTLGDPVRLGTRSTINKTPTDSAVFSTDGTILAQGEDYGAVRFWTFPLASTTPTPVQDNLTFAGGSEVAALAFAPNGMYYAVGGGSQLSIYGMGSPTELDRLAAPMLMDGIASIAFSPNGRAMILGQDNCGRVLVCY